MAAQTLDKLSDLLPAATNDDLLEVIVRALEVAVDRLRNYATDADERVDVVNEGIVFGYRIAAVLTPSETSSPLLHALRSRVAEYQNWLLNDLDDRGRLPRI